MLPASVARVSGSAAVDLVSCPNCGWRGPHSACAARAVCFRRFDKETGCKWLLRNLKLFVISKYGRDTTNELFYQVQMLVIRALLSVQKVMINDKHCFELYGYDVLIDDNFKPWLLEVNASPSLTADTAQDYELKTGMLEDLLDIIDLEGKRTGNEENVGGFDLIYAQGVARADKTGVTSLGCAITRTKRKALPRRTSSGPAKPPKN